ncbi:MAG: ATP-dependent Lon protease [Leptospira sp.]|nr:ATP-dependent Lon protease [Leptospira sp.]NCS93729.1 ATP-dependent Lon protease [Leptospira sp.]
MSISTIPIFPLPEVILFPGTFLPLHVFEPRYRSMIEYCSESDNEIAIAPIIMNQPKDVSSEQPLIEKVFGWGKIINKDYLPDGRSNIIIEGKGLLELINYKSTDPFLIGNVQEYKTNSIPQNNDSFQDQILNIIHLTKRILLSDGAPEELLVKINQLSRHPFPIDFITSILHFEFINKQAILIEKDPFVKIDLLKSVLEKINLQE